MARKLKNLVRKADQIEIQRLLEDTLRKLTSSIRLQMQAYHPKLLKNLTFKENLQSVLDSITNDSDTLVVLDCRDDIFLVEPYTMLICRFARELTETEKQVLRMLTSSMKRKEIAGHLFMSERTVSNHLQHIFEKLEVSSAVEAVTKAIQLGYIPPL